MEIGPLSEWVAAVAEVLAVVVALFLPYYTAYKQKKHQQRNLRLVLQKLVQSALREEPDSVKTLDLFLKIAFLGNTDDNNDQLLLAGNEILTTLKESQLDLAAKRQRVTALMAHLGIQLEDPHGA